MVFAIISRLLTPRLASLLDDRSIHDADRAALLLLRHPHAILQNQLHA